VEAASLLKYWNIKFNEDLISGLRMTGVQPNAMTEVATLTGAPQGSNAHARRARTLSCTAVVKTACFK
jgi:hypothetical protein